MASKQFPSSVHDVTVDWLTRSLREAGVIGEASVTSFEFELIGQGVGLMCLLHRIALTYDRYDDELPASLVLKTAVTNEQTRLVARTFQFYGKEVQFYRTAANLSPMETPQCMVAEHDPDTDEFVLLLEDLSHCETFNQLDGCPPDIAEISLTALARHHAAFWQHNAFQDKLAWLPYGWDAPIPEAIQEGVAGGLPKFLSGFGERFDDRTRLLCERLPEAIRELMYFPESPLTFVHGDFHIGNLFFKDREVVAFDWQFPMRTVGAYDLAYFISQNLTVPDRQAHEERLISLYRSTLTNAGVDYPLDQLMEDYRQVLLICLMPQILAGGGMELVNDKAVQLVIERLDRVVAAIDDHDAGELMP